MYDFLNDLAIANDWVFEYSRSDYQNLYNEMVTNKVHLFVDPITIDSEFSDTNVEIKSTCSGKLMLLLSSDVDETYQTKYTNYIKPIIDDAVGVMKTVMRCESFVINKFQCIEVINVLDYNLDGVLINYNITILP